MVHAPHYAAFDAAVDDSCTRRRGVGSAAGEGRTVDRDWSNNVTNEHRGSKILLVVIDVCQSMSHSPYVLLSHCAMLRPQQYSHRPSQTVTTNITSHPHPTYINRNTTGMKEEQESS